MIRHNGAKAVYRIQDHRLFSPALSCARPRIEPVHIHVKARVRLNITGNLSAPLFTELLFRLTIFKSVLQKGKTICSHARQDLEEIMTNVNLTLNGKAVSADVPDNTLLVSFIRETMALTGTHVGCDTSQCGACVVHVNGESLKSCTMLAVAAEGAEITTIEGIGRAESLHPMQQAFHENHGLQCGFCTPGMVMSAIELVEKNPNPSEQDVREGLEGNICRCTGYHNIVKSVQAGAQKMGE
jgi:carbon-monoxide dehydrogenase small subunit